MNLHRSSLATIWTSLDTQFKTTFATTVPAADAQSAFATLVGDLFKAFLTLTPSSKDADLATALGTVDTAKISQYLDAFDKALVKMVEQMMYVEAQLKAIGDFQAAVKKSVASFTKDLSKMVKAVSSGKEKGKKSWNDALEKEMSDQKKKAEAVQKALKANANVEQSASASASTSKIDAFFVKFATSVVTTNTAFSTVLAEYLTLAITEETKYTDSELALVSAQVSTIAVSLFQNADGKGKTCLKAMTSQFVAMTHNTKLLCIHALKIIQPMSHSQLSLSRFNWD